MLLLRVLTEESAENIQAPEQALRNFLSAKARDSASPIPCLSGARRWTQSTPEDKEQMVQAIFGPEIAKPMPLPHVLRYANKSHVCASHVVAPPEKSLEKLLAGTDIIYGTSRCTRELGLGAAADGPDLRSPKCGGGDLPVVPKNKNNERVVISQANKRRLPRQEKGVSLFSSRRHAHPPDPQTCLTQQRFVKQDRYVYVCTYTQLLMM
jgi:hypothetical protein